ncbi:Glycosyl transferase, group 1 [uncultured Mycobacterium sp.]|uniref:Glycosyl transferase, group 1 n=1 Tax=uncultured Mycobacterium sp. TaxID=171292 RepID=A0A1Y5PFX3_9MYCO|nr:Glycosyl transferase, group 1 [uncultured Mycobacterium sp.]
MSMPDERSADARIAIVHERLTEIAGSELVTEQLAYEWPTAPIHIPIVDRRTRASFADRVETGWLSTAYRGLDYRSYAPLLPLVPAWLRRRDFGAADAVVISHHAFAIAAAQAAGPRPTIAYVHSPARWAWDAKMRESEASSAAGRAALDVLSKRAIKNELLSCGKLTTIVANSSAVAERIALHWGREATVVHPPVDTEFYTPDAGEPVEDFFLLAGRLVPYKRPDIAIKAAIKAKVKLVVAGGGRKINDYKRIADDGDVAFLGRVSDDDLRSLQRRALACLLPGEEDFGIVPVEAMACGTPVLAVGVGGVCDSVIDGQTGVLVTDGDDAEVIDSFATALAEFDRGSFDSALIRQHAEGFSRAAFRRRMRTVVDQTLTARRKT